jgi:hypothetical protein
MTSTTPKGPSQSIPGTRPTRQSQENSQGQRTQVEAGKKIGADQFSLTNFNLVMKNMKATVSSQAKGQYDPTQLVRNQPPQVKTEELRAEMRQAAQSGKTELSTFEQVFMEYFLGGRSLGSALAAGEKKFREKALVEWKEFFESLEDFVVPIQKICAFIFRGKTKTHLVGDLHLQRERPVSSEKARSYREEKLVRVPLSMLETDTVQDMLPGDKKSSDDIPKLFPKNTASYLRLHHRPLKTHALTGSDAALARSLSRQSVSSAQASEILASQLGLSRSSSHLASQDVPQSSEQKKPRSKKADQEFDPSTPGLLDKLIKK